MLQLRMLFGDKFEKTKEIERMRNGERWIQVIGTNEGRPTVQGPPTQARVNTYCGRGELARSSREDHDALTWV